MSARADLLRRLLGISIVVLSLCAMSAADARRTIAFQGFLAAEDGAPLDADVDLTFRIYRGATGAARLWTERHTDVRVRAGLFLVALGANEPLENVPDLFRTDEALFVSVEVDGDGEMAPRLRLATTPFALSATDRFPAATTVDCTRGETIERALARAPATGVYTIDLVGTCRENVVITRNDTTLDGGGTAKILGVTPNAHGANAIVYVGGAYSVTLQNLAIEGAAGDATGMRGVVADDRSSVFMVHSEVRNMGGDGVLVVDGSSYDLRNSVVRNAGGSCVRLEGNAHIDLQDATVEVCGGTGLLLRIHSSATALRSTVRSAHASDYTVFVDDGSTLRVDAGNLFEASRDGVAALGIYRGSAVRVHGAGSEFVNTRAADYDAGPFASGLAMDVEMKSTFRDFAEFRAEGWIVAYNLSSIDIRNGFILGHVDGAFLSANVRLRDETATPGKVTVQGNVRSAGLSIRTGSEAARIDGNVDCRGGGGPGNVEFKDPEDGYINCPFQATDLSVALTGSVDSVAIGDTVTYTATMTNEALSPAVEAVNTNIRFDLSGADFTPQIAVSPGGGCSTDSGGASCFVGDVLTGEPAVVTLTVRRDGPGDIVADVSVTLQNTDSNQANNSASETTGTP